jgi:predicted nucleotidyltransferase
MCVPSDLERAVRDALASCDAVAAAWIFGSVARGDAGPDSDLDLAVLLAHDGGPTEQEREALSRAASALERRSPSGRVDVVVLGAAGPVLHHRVLREGRLVLDRVPQRRVDFAARAITEYLDWEPTHRIGMDAAAAGLQRRLARGAA